MDGGLTVLRGGLRRALARPVLPIGLWLLGLGTAALALAPALGGLAAVIDQRPAAAALADHRGDGAALALWGELVADHPTLPLGAFWGAGLGAALYGLLLCALTGGLVTSLRGGSFRERALALCGPSLRVAAWGLLVRLPVILLAAVTLAGANHLQVGRLGLGLLGLAFLYIWSLGGVGVRHGQALCAGGLPPFRALRRGLRLACVERPGPSLLLAGASLAGYGALIIGAGLAGASPVPLLLRQGAALARAVLGLTLLGASVELIDREARSAAVDAREGRSAAVDAREARSAAVDAREGRSAAADAREARSAVVDGTQGVSES